MKIKIKLVLYQSRAMCLDNIKAWTDPFLLSTYRQTRCNQISKSPRYERERKPLTSGCSFQNWRFWITEI